MEPKESRVDKAPARVDLGDKAVAAASGHDWRGAGESRVQHAPRGGENGGPVNPGHCRVARPVQRQRKADIPVGAAQVRGINQAATAGVHLGYEAVAESFRTEHDLAMEGGLDGAGCYRKVAGLRVAGNDGIAGRI